MSGYGKDYTQRDHGVLAGLSDDDHLQYVHLSNARTVSAIHTFTNGMILGSAGTIVRDGDSNTYFGFNGLSDQFEITSGGKRALKVSEIGVLDFLVNPDSDQGDFKVATTLGPTLVVKGQSVGVGFVYAGDSVSGNVEDGLLRAEPFSDEHVLVLQGYSSGQTAPMLQVRKFLAGGPPHYAEQITLYEDGLIEDRELSGDPSAPGTGLWGLYFKSDGLYYIEDDGTITGPLTDVAGATQNLWETIVTDDINSTTANDPQDILTIAGGEGIDTSISGDTVTIAGELATTANKGVASFSASHFVVTTGVVTLAAPNKFEGVSGDSGTAVADDISDLLTIAGGVGCSTVASDVGDTVTINCDLATTVTVGVASFDGTHFAVDGSGEVTLAEPDKWTTIAVSGETDVVASGLTDTLTFVAGTNVTIVTNGGTNIEISSTGGGGGITGSGTDNRLVRWDGTSDVQDSNWTLADSGDLSIGGTGTRTINYATSAAQLTISTTGNGNIAINAGTGDLLLTASSTQVGSGSPTRATGAGSLYVASELEVDGRITADAGIDIVGLLATPSGTGLYVAQNVSSGSAISAVNINIQNSGNGNLLCMNFAATMTGNGDVYGVQGTAVCSHESGTVSNAVGGYYFVGLDGAGGTTTAAVGARVSVDVSSGAILTGGSGLQVTLNVAGAPDATTVTNDIKLIDIDTPVVAAGFGSLSWGGALYGIYINDFALSTNPTGGAFEVWLDVDAGIWFRQSTCFINSSAANTLDLNTNTTLLFNVGGAEEMRLAANTLTFNNGASDTGFGWGTTNRLDIFIGATTEIRISSDSMTFENGATDTGLGWSTSGSLGFVVGATTEMALTADNLTFENGATDTALNWGTSGQLSFMVGATAEMRLTADTLTFENGATDTALAWGTSGRLDVNIGGGLEVSIAANKMTFNNTGSANLDWAGATTLEVLIGAVSVCTFGTSSIVCSQRVDASAEGVRTQYATRAEGGIPEDGDLDADFGLPGTVGSGFVGVWEDTTSGTVYLVATDGSGWHYVPLALALP